MSTDFDISNILIVVITLIAVIIGLMGRKRRTSQKPSAPGESRGESREGFLENLERILTMEQEKPEYVDFHEEASDLSPADEVIEEVVSAMEPESERVISPSGFASEYERILKELGSPGSISYIEGERSTEPLEVIELDEERKGTDYFEIVRNFDPGTAIVYSAIINRINY